MRKIELELEGVTVTAWLLDGRAPKTCQALWDVLPFEDMVTHSRWSGGRLHTHNHPKLDIDGSQYPFIENPSTYQAPGDVVVFPLTNELTVSYAPGRFGWMHQDWIGTHVTTIEGDMSQFARRIERLQWEGAKKLVIRRGRVDKEVKPLAAGPGAKIEIECEGKRWVAELFEERVPRHSNALLEALPIEGPITNMHGSGELFHYWVKIPGAPEEPETTRERWPIDYQEKQVGTSAVAFFDPREMRGHNPGDLLYAPTEGILIVHGQGAYGRGCQKIGRIIQGDLTDFQELASRVEWEGAKTMRMKRLS